MQPEQQFHQLRLDYGVDRRGLARLTLSNEPAGGIEQAWLDASSERAHYRAGGERSAFARFGRALLALNPRGRGGGSNAGCAPVQETRGAPWVRQELRCRFALSADQAK